MRRAARLAPALVLALVLVAGALLGGCAARKTMQQQAVLIASSAEAIDDDVARLDGALDTVHRLRRVRVEGDHLAADRTARETEVLLGAWRLEHDPLSQAKVEVFEGVREASDTAATHGYGVIDYKLGVARPVPGYQIDRAALRKLANLLLSLASPPAFMSEAGFFVEYAIRVGEASEEGVGEVVHMINEQSTPPPPAPEAETEPSHE